MLRLRRRKTNDLYRSDMRSILAPIATAARDVPS
jgi:hypothetical protein